jgi:hypothetical protein
VVKSKSLILFIVTGSCGLDIPEIWNNKNNFLIEKLEEIVFKERDCLFFAAYEAGIELEAFDKMQAIRNKEALMQTTNNYITATQANVVYGTHLPPY